MEIGKEWDKFYKMQDEIWNSFNQMTMKQKLASIMKDIEDQSKLNDIWKNLDGGDHKKISVKIDLDAGTYEVKNQHKDSNRTIEHHYSLNTKTGDAVESLKNVTSGSEKVIESHIDVQTLKAPTSVPQNVIDAMN